MPLPIVNTWADGKWGFVGGGVDKSDATPLDCMNREFDEEMGTSGRSVFEESDYLYTVETVISKTKGNSKSSFFHIFCKVTDDLNFFSGLLSNFYSERDHYLEEILGVMALPLWIEAPNNISDVCWANNVFGIPRFICGNAGTGCITTQTLDHPLDDFRDQFLVTLLLTKVVSISLMSRIFYISRAKPFQEAMSLQLFEEFVSQSGLRLALMRAYDRFLYAAVPPSTCSLETMDELIALTNVGSSLSILERVKISEFVSKWSDDNHCSSGGCRHLLAQTISLEESVSEYNNVSGIKRSAAAETSVLSDTVHTSGSIDTESTYYAGRKSDQLGSEIYRVCSDGAVDKWEIVKTSRHNA